MLVTGSLLFAAGYTYTRLQAEYAAAQNTLTKASVKTTVVFPIKSVPSFVFRTDKPLSSFMYN